MSRLPILKVKQEFVLREGNIQHFTVGIRQQTAMNLDVRLEMIAIVTNISMEKNNLSNVDDFFLNFVKHISALLTAATAKIGNWGNWRGMQLMQLHPPLAAPG